MKCFENGGNILKTVVTFRFLSRITFHCFIFLLIVQVELTIKSFFLSLKRFWWLIKIFIFQIKSSNSFFQRKKNTENFPVFSNIPVLLEERDTKDSDNFCLSEIDDGTKNLAVRFSLIKQRVFWFQCLLPTCIAKMFAMRVIVPFSIPTAKCRNAAFVLRKESTVLLAC